MYSALLLLAMTGSDSGQCPNGVCPLQRIATVALAPVAAVNTAVRGGCSGTARSRFLVAPRAGCAGTAHVQRTGCTGGSVASVAPQVVAPPMPMTPPVVKDPPKAPVVAVAVPVAVSGPKVDVLRHAPLREFWRNRMTAGMPF